MEKSRRAKKDKRDTATERGEQGRENTMDKIRPRKAGLIVKIPPFLRMLTLMKNTLLEAILTFTTMCPAKHRITFLCPLMHAYLFAKLHYWDDPLAKRYLKFICECINFLLLCSVSSLAYCAAESSLFFCANLYLPMLRKCLNNGHFLLVFETRWKWNC